MEPPAIPLGPGESGTVPTLTPRSTWSKNMEDSLLNLFSIKIFKQSSTTNITT